MVRLFSDLSPTKFGLKLRLFLCYNPGAAKEKKRSINDLTPADAAMHRLVFFILSKQKLAAAVGAWGNTQQGC